MISKAWLNSLRLESRKPPEFIQPTDNLSGIPHGALIRRSFDELGLAAIHCISGVPSIAFLLQDEFDRNAVDCVHKALWNQGLASVLLVITHETLRAYSLAQIPTAEHGQSNSLVRIFNLVNDALELKNLVLGVESGRFIAGNEKKFNSNYRVDQVLLGNLEATVKKLADQGIRLESAQALLMQVMFIAYLEDKEIINAEYFQKATENLKIESLKLLLSDGCPANFLKMFLLLKEHFNGDMFVAPCTFDPEEESEQLGANHIKVLSEFRAGNINLNSGQYQIWPYDFRFIPVELISAVYDRFLGFNPVSKRETGAYYTPMFLADLVVEQAWSELSDHQKNDGGYVDPSCGSGIFLVRLFEKMVDQWRASHQGQRPAWSELLLILGRLHGFDNQKASIRVAAFSLYIALLENAKPAEILGLMAKGRLLPKLCGETLHATDFFTVPTNGQQYDLVIGNPPWVSRRGNHLSAEAWCKANNYRMPAKEIAWGFTWKALDHANENGVIALLLKATSVLTNHSESVITTRKQWMNQIRLVRIVNFADTRFQLFDGGDAPTALVVYKPKGVEDESYSFDYWAPKADLNLKTKRLITLSSADQARLPIQLVKQDHLLMKRRMWMQTPDAKLFQYLSYFPKLGEKLITYKMLKKSPGETADKWIIGQGFIPHQERNLENPDYKTFYSNLVTTMPHLETKMFNCLVMPEIINKPWPTNVVYRKGFEQGFKAPHILIPQGIERAEGRLRASYCIQDLSFRDSIQAISFEKKDQREAKFLTVLLNSSLTAWFLFHHSSNTGMERDKVHEEQLLDIPYPMPGNTDNEIKSRRAFDQGVALIDRLLEQKDEVLRAGSSEYMKSVDRIVYDYFGLNEADILLIEDTLKHVIPSMQPRPGSKNLPSLWQDTHETDWIHYSKWLSFGLARWLKEPCRAVVERIGASPDLIVLGIHLSNDEKIQLYANSRSNHIDNILPKIWNSLPNNMTGNFQLIPDLRIFIDDVLYMVKPRKKRFWLGSTALADADAIASDLLAQAR